MDIRYYLVKNGTDTAAKAPYTIRVVPNGVANLNDLVAEILTRISSSEQRVRMVVAEATKVMLGHVLAGETVDFGGIRFKAQIPGSMDYEDSPFTPGVDEVVVCAYVDDELRDTFDGIVPVKLTAEEVAASVKVSNVMDIATENFGEIHGTAPFKVLGNGVTLDAEGESAKLVDRKTGAELASAEVDTVSKGQRATCRFNPTAGGIAAGSYWLVITTFGLVGETTPRVFRKPVTLVEAVPAPSLPKTAIRELSVTREEDAPDSLMIEMKVDHPEAVLDYEAPSEDSEGAIQLKTRINGGESRVYHAGGSVGSDVWRAMISEAAQVGDSVEVTLPHNPEATGYDPADAVATTTVKAG